MSLAIISPGKNVQPWIEVLKNLDSTLKIQVYPEIEAPEEVEAVMLWNHPSGILSNFPNLKLISSMGAGVDHILRDDSVPKDIPVVRIVDEKLTWSMTNYVIMGVLNFHRQITRYQKDQKRKVWDMSNPEIDVKVGVMGVGALGGDVLDKLSYMGFPVAGFGFSEKSNFPHPYYSKDKLKDFLGAVNVLVCLLPLTPDTENILDIELFSKCTPGTFLINVARGKHLVEEDVIKALNEGFLSGALLDVYRKEPLPKDHFFWEEDRIQLTPHIASVTNPQAAAPQVIENIQRIRSNQPLKNLVIRERGY
ncbi:2-hydroxyacid dehydrogenase [Algoriphagus machipongonensis]|uniref:D-isomer specific 2-hydroxyacid dehydrogenase family protein n=1 Tax=Algoriphagus machipongonensis TaxID=388413 RepID=A3HTF9_9BACT|nr:glyoxylate/hydroxypyruvate reductase A [Algoriphagus machipongonensis]EAZ83127.1 D-isomer specific 2-hydroxyacid dehydrogenase family protein [Algoriphagus machipongonensis]